MSTPIDLYTLSICCQASVVVRGNVTHWYECTNCKQPCMCTVKVEPNKPHLGVNEQTFLDYIEEMRKEHPDQNLSPEWLRWMMLKISRCYQEGAVINPQYLRSVWGLDEPPMFISPPATPS